MSEPKRIQLRRTKGWRKPEGAIVVARPGYWGNPFKAGERIDRDDPRWPWLTLPGQSAAMFAGLSSVTLLSRQTVVDVHGWWLIQQPHLMASLSDLRGHDLCCWCPLDQPCHADMLLELANG